MIGLMQCFFLFYQMYSRLISTNLTLYLALESCLKFVARTTRLREMYSRRIDVYTNKIFT